MIHKLVYYYPYEDWCAEHHPELNVVRCTTAYLFLKEDPDAIFALPNAITEFKEHRTADKIRDTWMSANKYGFYMALFLYMMKIEVFKRR